MRTGVIGMDLDGCDWDGRDWTGRPYIVYYWTLWQDSFTNDRTKSSQITEQNRHKRPNKTVTNDRIYK